MGCTLCPRNCNADRKGGALGFCQMPYEMHVARAALHPFEEPPISGTRGSGTVFFSGCSLRCVFCQNRTISRGQIGRRVSPEELAEQMLSLQNQGVHNINLVTPTHFTDKIVEALSIAKPHLHVPVVWNSSGYERPEVLRTLCGLVDIYLPDLKYASQELARDYSSAPDYPEVAMAAIAEMVRQRGTIRFSDDGLCQSGVIVRLLVLPGHRKDAIESLRRLAQAVNPADIRLSLMSPYTPEFALDAPYDNLHRRLTRFEYDSVVNQAIALGFDGYLQDASSATAAYTPDFEKEQV